MACPLLLQCPNPVLLSHINTTSIFLTNSSCIGGLQVDYTCDTQSHQPIEKMFTTYMV